jgi:hypothetical protein
LENLKCYVDDNFSFSCTGDLEFYEKYKVFWPSDQVKLLQLWDKIDLPHKENKQISGLGITIIGFKVDPNAMTVTMSKAKRSELINACSSLISLVLVYARTPTIFANFRTFIRLYLIIFHHYIALYIATLCHNSTSHLYIALL